MRRGLLILSAFGYGMFLIAGVNTGAGVYRTPAFCFAAFACAVVAAACVSNRPRLYWSIAAAAAVVCGVYGYRQNSEWREKLKRAQAQQQPPPAIHAETNR
jgi:hypothetical protein